MKRQSCPMCTSSEIRTLCSMPCDTGDVFAFLETYYQGRVDASHLQGTEYTLCECQQCHSCFQQEILDESAMALLYGKWIPSETSKEKLVDVTRQVELARHCGRLLRLFSKPDNVHLLDYGMGWGDWCHMAQSFGFTVTGVELDPERITFAASRGIKAYLPEDLPKGPYDFIYLEQVLEHLPTPFETMQHITSLLKDNGFVHIAVPNGASVSSTAQKTPIALLRKGPAQPLEHINIFTHASLIAFMKQFDCHPVSQREALLRCTNMKQLFRDTALMVARMLPASIFPHKTNLLFQKKTTK